MSRVTPTEVKQIVSTALDDSIVQTWIDGANTIVTDSSECIGGVETLLTKVELYLSAHFIAMLDPELRGFVTKEKLDVFETSYSNDITMQNNIDNTPYGTTANMLSKGCLANSSDRAVSFCSL
jgi:hypothetical protein